MSDRARHARTLFAGIAPEYEWMGAVLSFGQDARWRRTMVSKVNALPGSLVLDVASGTGLVARELAARKRLRVVQLDPSEDMLRAGIPRDGGGGARAAGSPNPRPCRTAAVRRRDVRCRHVHVPAALRRRSRGHHARARARPATGRHARLPGVLPSRGPNASRRVVGVHAGSSCPWWVPSSRRRGATPAGSWDRASAGSTIGIRSPSRSRWWQAAGLRHVRTRVMSLGAGIVIWAVKDGPRVL